MRLREEEEPIAMMKEDPSQLPGLHKEYYRLLLHERRVFARLYRHTGRIKALMDWLRNPVPPPQYPLTRRQANYEEGGFLEESDESDDSEENDESDEEDA